MAKTIPYLFLGDAKTTEKAFSFYKEIGIKILNESRVTKEQAEKYKMEEGSLMHVTTQWGGMNAENRIDMSQSMDKKVRGSVLLNFDNNDQAKAKMEQIFKHLSQGAKDIEELHESFWNSIFGKLTDKFGITWQFNMELS